MEFQDAIREGDGERVLNCCRYVMILFKATGHRNYAIEAFMNLAQNQCFIPPRQAMQFKYSRFINVHGRHVCSILGLIRLNEVFNESANALPELMRSSNAMINKMKPFCSP